MNIAKFAEALQDQCQELDYLRSENYRLKAELAKYQTHVSEELNFWNSTYSNILTNLVEKEPS